VTVSAAPPLAVTVALNVVLPFLGTVAVAGFTDTLVTVGICTVAVPEMRVSSADVAFTVRLELVSPDTTVK
jgi:hypothetical protein